MRLVKVIQDFKASENVVGGLFFCFLMLARSPPSFP